MTTKTLIALAVIAAGTIAADQPELAAGATIPDVPDDIAATMIETGQAKLAGDPPPDKPAAERKRKVRARVLLDCAAGQANDVVELPAAEATALERAGQIDTDAAAVAYALTLRR